MILQNKKTGQRISLSQEQYDNLTKVGFASKWTIISRDEDQPLKPKALSPEILSFAEIKKPKKAKTKK